MFFGRVVAPGEPLWTDEDRAWALALADVERDVCPDCGHPWSETSRPEAEGTYRAELLRCHACAAGATTAHTFEQSNGDTRGIHLSIHKKE
ncbi:hypothetical protein [Streptomyces sp. t39]|uniref:hypothetical protein n=1 Tax=Streptomyces sp. t39 TaxID=1828156 RepID=UPI0021C8D51D|nr:hypothetical protein [Streptomyces sp. t39]